MAMDRATPPRAQLAAVTTGTCSFCGKDARIARTMIGTTAVAPRICDDCIGLAGCIILQMVGDRIEERPASQLEPEHVSAAVARLITKVAAGELPRSTTKVDVPEWPFRCNFCWADQADVATLVSGPRVFICERCVEDAVAFVHQLPR